MCPDPDTSILDGQGHMPPIRRPEAQVTRTDPTHRAWSRDARGATPIDRAMVGAIIGSAALLVITLAGTHVHAVVDAMGRIVG